jgi:trimethylamine--corrinoid protein Co-methyltransferase
MRTGTPPMGAIETMMIDAATAELGGRLGLPTHAYLAMSDAKVADYQAGLETGMGALVAALSGVSLASGPGFLDFESCQSLEKLVLDAEACAMALRAVRGIERRDDVMALETIREGLAAEGSFLALGHTRRWFRAEHRFPGPVIDRTVGEVWATTGGKRTAFDRARDEVAKLLAKDPPALPLPEEVLRALDELARLPRSSDQ